MDYHYILSVNCCYLLLLWINVKLGFVFASFSSMPTTPNHTSWTQAYDYIIVGAGAAGSVIASRLSEDPSVSVLLLEAGGLPDSVSDIPLTWSILKSTKYDWNFYTEKQDVACFGFKNHKISWPSGHGLGGSTLLSNGLYTRGHPSDFDTWSAIGAIGWSWFDVLPFFLRAETLVQAPQLSAYLNISTSPYQSKLGEFWTQVGKTFGYQTLSGELTTQSGFSAPEGLLSDGCRMNIGAAYLGSVKRRPNLNVQFDSRVTRILFDDHKRAIGVQYVQKTNLYQVRSCRREVIVSAGTINSAQLLLLSGIGPGDHLRDLGIPVLVDLPVGENLQDHVYASGLDFKISQLKTIKRQSVLSTENLRRYVVEKNGPLTLFGGIEGIGYLNSADSENDTVNWPDIGLYLVNGDFNENLDNRLDNLLAERQLSHSGSVSTFSILPVLLRPKSRGTVRLRSQNPLAQPIINPNYLTHPDDILTLVRAMKAALSVGLATPYAQLGAEAIYPKLSDCDQYAILTEKYLACWARVLTSSFHSASGTCRMGPSWDPAAVVDTELQVIGVSRLRVVDASVMPNIISGPLMGATIMIAERAAESIKRRSHLVTVDHSGGDTMSLNSDVVFDDAP